MTGSITFAPPDAPGASIGPYEDGIHFSSGNGDTAIRVGYPASGNVIDLPTRSGTLALTSDIPAVPAKATTVPLIAGTAAIGSSDKYAAEDHVHPTDTSRVAVSGDTMTGPLNFGDAFLDPTDGTICYGGSLNGTLIKLEEMSLWDPHSGTESAKRWTMEVTRDGTPGLEDIATLDDLEQKLDADQRNVVPYAESVDLTLDPVVSVYRLSPTGTSISIPSPVTTALPATDGYYQFEIELAVPSTATSLTAPSGWTWLTGFELPSSGYAGKTVFVSCRMDLRGNAVTASCWRVA